MIIVYVVFHRIHLYDGALLLEINLTVAVYQARGPELSQHLEDCFVVVVVHRMYEVVYSKRARGFEVNVVNTCCDKCYRPI